MREKICIVSFCYVWCEDALIYCSPSTSFTLLLMAWAAPSRAQHTDTRISAPAAAYLRTALDTLQAYLQKRSINVLAIGPGLSTHEETQQFIRAIVRECPLPIILDADGLNAFPGRLAELCDRTSAFLALTPHPGEMARMTGVATADVQLRRMETALKAAAVANAIVILKGQGTILAAPDGTTFINSTGNPGMATGGTGDVLTGMLAGLTAQFGTGDWLRVLSLGVYLHGLAGDLAAAELGEHGMLASDLVRHIPAAFQRVCRAALVGGTAKTQDKTQAGHDH